MVLDLLYHLTQRACFARPLLAFAKALNVRHKTRNGCLIAFPLMCGVGDGSGGGVTAGSFTWFLLFHPGLSPLAAGSTENVQSIIIINKSTHNISSTRHSVCYESTLQVSF